MSDWKWKAAPPEVDIAPVLAWVKVGAQDVIVFGEWKGGRFKTAHAHDGDAPVRWTRLPEGFEHKLLDPVNQVAFEYGVPVCLVETLVSRHRQIVAAR